MARTAALVVAGWLLAGASPARAGPVWVSTARAPLPAREVERAPVLSEGWSEIALTWSRKRCATGFDGEGRRVPLDTSLVATSWAATVRHGLAPRVELFGSMPARRVEQGTGAVSAGAGEPVLGVRALLAGGPWPDPALAVELTYEAPGGLEPSGIVAPGLPPPLGAGNPDLAGRVIASHAVGAARLTLDLGSVWRAPAVVAFEVGAAPGGGRVDPGDVALAGGELLVQVGPLALVGGTSWSRRGPFRVAGRVVAGSAGWALDAGFEARLGLSRGLGVGLSLDHPVRGEDMTLVPLEDVHPAVGTTWSAGVVGRF